MGIKDWTRKNKEDFYLPGEEIKINSGAAFQKYSCEKDPLSVCKNRLLVAVLGFIFVYSVIAFRVFDLCVISNLGSGPSNADLRAYAVNPIRRADIMDRNGTIIATSLPTVNLYANPRKILDADAAARQLVEVLPEFKVADVAAKLKSRGSFVYIKRNLTPSQQYQINYLGIPGLEFENGEKRVYPHKNLFAHIIGATNIDNQGISGIEKALDERLTQSDIPLVLSVDAGVQDTIREILRQGMTKFEAAGATAVLMKVDTSEIIAMVSLPDFDPNINRVKNEKALFNMAAKGVYEPGSVLKIFNTAMSLESGKVKVADRFDATKPLKLRHNVIKDYRGENRWLSVPEILVYSSNIGSAQMALKVGSAEQRQFLEKIGFFEELDVELAEKGQPLVPRRWGESTVATVAFGYGLAVSPLHVITGYAAMVNGGVYHSPTLLKDKAKREGHRVISFNTSKEMRKLMRLVVTDGSGKRANVAGYEVGGKTGTANKLNEHGKYVDKKVRTTFVSAFPISNPQYALIVMLDEPKPLKETWGFVTSGWNTVPTAAGIIEAIAPQLNLKANYDLDELRRSRIIEAGYKR